METPMLDFFARANSKDWRVIAYIVDVNDNKRSPIELTSIEIEFIRQQRLEISKKELQEQKDFLDNRYRDVIK